MSPGTSVAEMDLERLIEGLSEPRAFPERPSDVEVRQTHISVVFLTDRRAYKLKKPVELGFVDYGDLERRRHFCEREVELNRRTTDGVYLGTVPIRSQGGELAVDGDRGDVVEWAVEMERLPADATLDSRIEVGESVDDVVGRTAARIAAFHDRARSGEDVAEYGTFESVARNVRENFAQSAEQVGETVDPAVFDRAEELSGAALDDRRELIDRRADRGAVVDGHGDLRLEHVYHLPDRQHPADLQVVDCVEFDPALRCADPVSDAAFVAMDLRRVGRWELSDDFVDAYLAESGDREGRALVPLYIAYRAAVRAKVMGLKAVEAEVPPRERRRAARRARGRWSLVLDALADPGDRPGLVLVGGLPATGKSTLAGRLAGEYGFDAVDTDVVRKELAGLDPDESAGSAVDEGIYTEEWSDRTYEECRRRAEERLRCGERVAVDGTFNTRRRRRPFIELAKKLNVRWLWVECRADAATARERIRGRERGPSDADMEVYRAMRDRRDQPGGEEVRGHRVVETDRPLRSSRAAVRDHLVDAGLLGST